MMGITTKEYHEGYQQGYKEAKEEFQNTLCKYQKIQEIINNTDYIQEDVIRYKMICGVVKDGSADKRAD